jgi:N-acetylglucosaminyl-diphospho-decaprenol L-rhamnosyltransferase
MAIAREVSSPEVLLAVIIVNFRTPDLTIDCLRSVAAEIADQSGVRVFVVENGSGDDSFKKIGDSIGRAGWQSWCTLELSDKNLGFSGGNNLGIASAYRAGGAKYFLLLNSDTIVQPGCFARCIEILDADPGIGALSCCLINADGSIQNVCRKFPTPLRCFVAQSSLPWRFPAWFSWADCEDMGWDRNTIARDVEWIGGAFMMLRGDWIERHNALDDRFFFYGEDVELCHRMWRTGFRCHYDPGSTVIHLGGGSSDPSRMAMGARSFHQWRGRYLIQEICYGKSARIFLQAIDLLTVVRRVAWARIAGRANTTEYAAMHEVARLLMRNWSTWSKREA